MLLSFSTSNYKSFKDSAKLDLVATADKEHINENTFLANNQRLLKTIAIYGANASGKTNLLTAFGFMRSLVLYSANNQVGDRIPVVGFKLGNPAQKRSSRFEVDFIIDSIRYKYGFEINEIRVVKEWLDVYHTTRSQRWFDREFSNDEKKYIWKFSNRFKGQTQSWQEQTLENTLFLSRASQLNSEQLKPVYQWFKNLYVLGAAPLDPQDTATWCLESEENKNNVLAFLKASGDNSGISNINIEEEEVPNDQLPKWFAAMNKTKDKDHKLLRRTIEMIHKTVPLSFNEESAGTCKLFSLAKFWLWSIKEGRVLVIDELNNSLHSLLARFLIQMFHDKEINSKGAQLIFTGHDSFLLDLDIFRRDQIWFTEKNEREESDLYSLAEYSPRKKESIEKGYLKGRYGAIPLIDETILS